MNASYFASLNFNELALNILFLSDNCYMIIVSYSLGEKISKVWELLMHFCFFLGLSIGICEDISKLSKAWN